MAISAGFASAQVPQFYTSMPVRQLPNQPTGQEYLYPYSGTAMGDITGDGFDDMLFALVDTSGNGQVLKMGAYDGATGQYLPAHEHADPNAAPYSNGNWGQAICVIGDMNGDGSSEYAVADPVRGRVIVYWGGVAPTSPFSDNILCRITWEPGLTNSRFGAALSKAGDMNGDGILDLLVGDWRVHIGGGNQNARDGAVYVISGNELIEEWKYASANFQASGGAGPSIHAGVNIGKITRLREATGNRYIGRYIAGGMDATGDGIPDILVSADEIDWVINTNPSSTGSGVLFYSGNRLGQPIFVFRQSTTIGAQSHVQVGKHSFGDSLCFIGDVEGPGVAPNGRNMETNDILIGDPGNPGQGDPGFAFVFSSADASLVEVHMGSVVNGRGSLMGKSVASAGDVFLNGQFDGFGDYYLAEQGYRTPGDGTSSTYTRGKVSLVKGGSSTGTQANSSYYPDWEVGALPTSKFGKRMTSSGLAQVRVLPPNSLTMAPGFMAIANWDGVSNDPLGITSEEFH